MLAGCAGYAMLIKIPGVKWAAQRMFRLQRGMTLGVRAIIADERQNVILVRHGYAHGWHLPGGGVDRGESIHDAVVREVREETGAAVMRSPRLFGLYTNFEAFPGDHVALFVVEAFERGAEIAPSFEIRECRAFAITALPDGTTEGTRRRLVEVFGGAAQTATW
jgi:ADP-ribose pyrophosphatase YjhB (NUDIX family)